VRVPVYESGGKSAQFRRKSCWIELWKLMWFSVSKWMVPQGQIHNHFHKSCRQIFVAEFSSSLYAIIDRTLTHIFLLIWNKATFIFSRWRDNCWYKM